MSFSRIFHLTQVYKCLSPSGHLYISKHVLFSESRFPYNNLFSPKAQPSNLVSKSVKLSPIPLHSFNPIISTSHPITQVYPSHVYPLQSRSPTPSIAQTSHIHTQVVQSHSPTSSTAHASPIQLPASPIIP